MSHYYGTLIDAFFLKVIRNAKQGSMKDLVAIANSVNDVPSNLIPDVTSCSARSSLQTLPHPSLQEFKELPQSRFSFLHPYEGFHCSAKIHPRQSR